MDDVMAQLKDRRSKAESKLARAAKALESAKKELADLQAAERVMADITGQTLESVTGSTSISDRDRNIAKLLEVGSDAAISPADLHSRYVDETGETINLEAFRTALWRLQKKTVDGDEHVWIVRSQNGRYWRESVSEKEDLGEFPE